MAWMRDWMHLLLIKKRLSLRCYSLLERQCKSQKRGGQICHLRWRKMEKDKSSGRHDLFSNAQLYHVYIMITYVQNGLDTSLNASVADKKWLGFANNKTLFPTRATMSVSKMRWTNLPHEMEKGKSSGWYDLFPDAQRCHVCIANT